jgi:hypothetical protein
MIDDYYCNVSVENQDFFFLISNFASQQQYFLESCLKTYVALGKSYRVTQSKVPFLVLHKAAAASSE